MCLPSWLRDGTEFGEQGLDLKLDSCITRPAMFRRSTQELARNVRDASEQDRYRYKTIAQELLREAQEIDHDLIAWEMSLPPDWAYSTETRSAQLQKEMNIDGDRMFYANIVPIYSSLQQAAQRNRYRAARVISSAATARILLSCHSFPSHSFDADIWVRRERARSTVHSMIDDICASVPFHFGHFTLLRHV